MDNAMHPLQKILTDSGTFEPRPYSGRGMYGKECLGIDVPNGFDAGDLFAEIMFAGAIYSELGENDLIEIAKAFKNMSQDSLGRGTILHFPSIPC
jgi:hypothetical protein